MGTSNSSNTDEWEIAGGERNVSVRKVQTRNGERLEIIDQRSGRAARFDSLELESVTWQSDQFFTDILGVSKRPPVDVTPQAFAGDSMSEISNEYALVQIAVADAPNGDRLLVRSVKTGHMTHLGGDELAALADQEKAFFSNLLRTPLGPESKGH